MVNDHDSAAKSILNLVSRLHVSRHILVAALAAGKSAIERVDDD
jgi:hypothetical protein